MWHLRKLVFVTTAVFMLSVISSALTTNCTVSHHQCVSWYRFCSRKEERVCSECLMSNSQLETVTGRGTDDSENSEFLETIEIPKKRSMLWSDTSHDSSGKTFGELMMIMPAILFSEWTESMADYGSSKWVIYSLITSWYNNTGT